jgi:hypothetical protein
MFLRPLALLFAVPSMAFAGGLVGSQSLAFPKEDPNPSLIVNGGERACRVRISQDLPIGLVKCYASGDSNLQNPTTLTLQNQFYVIGPRSSAWVVICPDSLKYKKLVVELYLSVDLAKDASGNAFDDQDSDVSLLHFTHGQYNKDLLIGSGLLRTIYDLGLTDSMPKIPPFEQQAVTVKKADDRIAIATANYQKGDSGALWQIK